MYRTIHFNQNCELRNINKKLLTSWLMQFTSSCIDIYVNWTVYMPLNKISSIWCFTQFVVVFAVKCISVERIDVLWTALYLSGFSSSEWSLEEDQNTSVSTRRRQQTRDRKCEIIKHQTVRRTVNISNRDPPSMFCIRTVAVQQKYSLNGNVKIEVFCFL